jgi:hypothetical protein
MIQLKKNAISTKMYKWFYHQDWLEDNFCKYFQKLLIMYVFIIPIIIISLPALLVDGVRNIFCYDKIGLQKPSVLAHQSLLYIMIVTLTTVALSPLILFFKDVHHLGVYENLVTCGFGLDGGIIGLSMCVFIFYIVSEKMKPLKIIGEYYKAKKEKYCPKIDWK